MRAFCIAMYALGVVSAAIALGAGKKDLLHSSLILALFGRVGVLEQDVRGK